MKNKLIIFIVALVLALACFGGALFLGKNKSFNVTFDTNGGSYISSQVVKKGEYITKPVNPTKSGYEFVEWQYNGQSFDFSKKVFQDMKLVAIWEKIEIKHFVILEVDGEKRTLEVVDGKLIDIKDIEFPVKVGFEIRWYNEKDELFDLENEQITENITLRGKYEEVKTYSVTFDTDGGSQVEAQIVNENRTAIEPEEPEKEGFVLEGWYLDNVKYEFTEKVTSDITLKAKWVEDSNIKKFEVKFDSDGGSTVTSQKVIEGKKAKEPKTPTKNGYNFEGWFLNGKKYNFNEVVKGNITLKASWKEKVYYTVSFNSNSGSKVDSQKIESGYKASKPKNPTREDYVFLGWKLNGNDYDFNSLITKNITLDAAWRKLETYTVTFDSNGGNEITNSQVSVKEGNKVQKPSDPTKAGHTFLGWTLNGKTFDFNTVITGNITLKASWKEHTYTIKFTQVQEYELDTFSPDFKVTIWNGSNEITDYQKITYENGNKLCDRNTPFVSRIDFEGINTFYVVFSDELRIKAVK